MLRPHASQRTAASPHLYASPPWRAAAPFAAKGACFAFLFHPRTSHPRHSTDDPTRSKRRICFLIAGAGCRLKKSIPMLIRWYWNYYIFYI
jgi:hypothetical protein